MRSTFLPTLVFVLGTTAAFGQQAGDRIVVIAANAQLKKLTDIVGTVPKGETLTAQQVNGDWLWVTYSSGKGTTQGWIKRRDVVPFDKALDFFNDELRRTPTAEFYTIRGTLFGQREEYDKALSDFNEALRLDPGSSIAYRRRGIVWSRKGDLDKAVHDYDEALRLDPLNAVSLGYRGTAWLMTQQYDKAIADYTAATRLDPKFAAAYCNRGFAFYKRREFDRAIADFNEALRLDPKNALPHVARGSAWYEKGEYESAKADFNQAIRLGSNDAETYGMRGSTCHKMGEYGQAIADCSEAIRLNPKLGQAYTVRGITWYYEDEYAKAVADLKEAILLQPTETYAYSALALIHAECPVERFRDGKEAVKLATKACELSDWKNAYCVCTLGAAYAEAGDFEKAVKWQEKCLELSSESEKNKWGYLLDLYKSGKPSRAGSLQFRFGDSGRNAVKYTA